MPKDIEYEYMTLEDIQQFLLSSDRAKGDFLYKIEKRGGKHVLPPGALSLMGSLTDGTVKRRWKENPVEVAETLETVGAGGCNLEVGVDTDSGGIIEVYAILVSFLVDATVADRTAVFRVPDIGLSYCTAVLPNTLAPSPAVTLSASQWGFLTLLGGSERSWLCDNGSVTASATYITMPLKVSAGCSLKGVFSANGQAADKSQLAIIYKEAGVE